MTRRLISILASIVTRTLAREKSGATLFVHIVNDPRFKKLPGCLETPKSKDLHEDVENLAVLRSLVV
jgi:deoxyribonuclease-4